MPAPWILWRRILRDLLLHSLVGLAAFTLFIVVQSLIRFLEGLLDAGVGILDIVRLVPIVLPGYLAYGIPTALLFGVLLTFGRMSGDGEIIAMRASGISVRRMLPPIVALGLLATLCTGYLQWEVEPHTQVRIKALMRHLDRAERLVQPGTFRALGDRTLYVHSLGDATCPLQGVMIADFEDPTQTLYIAAECARIESDPERPYLTFELERGSIHMQEDSTDRYRRVRFGEMEIHLDVSGYLDPGRRARDFTMAELWELDAQFARGEGAELRGEGEHRNVQLQIQRRLSFPFAALVLAVLALPLGIRPARSGRSWGALVAVAVMSLYWVLFTLAEITVENSWLPAWVALWLPNVAAGGLAVGLIRWANHTDA